MKTREQKIKDVARELANILEDRQRLVNEPYLEGFAEQLVDAAEHETPVWPTDESIDAANKKYSRDSGSQRDSLRAAMLADPIIKAAIAFAEAYELARPDHESRSETWIGRDLIDAVKEAGLVK